VGLGDRLSLIGDVLDDIPGNHRTDASSRQRKCLGASTGKRNLSESFLIKAFSSDQQPSQRDIHAGKVLPRTTHRRKK